MVPVIRIDTPQRLVWKAFRSPSSTRWLAVCEALKSTCEARSLDDLYRKVDDATQQWFVDLVQGKKLQQCLTERGWQATDVNEAVGSSDIRFDVPWELVAPSGFLK